MRTAAIAKLKATLSEYIDRVKSGEVILITDRGKPVAKIMPIGKGITNNAERNRLTRLGIIRPGKGSISKKLLDDLPKTGLPQEIIKDVIDKEREDRI